MKDFIDIEGASGARYRFMRFREGRPLSPMGGNFIFGRFTGERFEVVFAGQVMNLLKDARERWTEAHDRFGASELYIRLNISERARTLEHDDILAAANPPMNGASQRARPS